MTTVGYGDIFPITHHGRVFTVLACIWGTFIVSILIVSLTTLMTLSNEEEEAYNEMIKDSQNKSKLVKDADNYIRSALHFYLKRKIEYSKVVINKEASELRLRKLHQKMLLFKKRFLFVSKVVNDANPDVFEEIKTLNCYIEDYKTKSAKRAVGIKSGVQYLMSVVRSEQIKIDVNMLTMYDHTLKLTSYLKLCNDRAKYRVSDLDEITEFYDHQGNSDRQTKTKKFLIDLFNSRKPILVYYENMIASRKVAQRLKQ